MLWWGSARVRPTVALGRARIAALGGRAGFGGDWEWTAGGSVGWQLAGAPLDLFSLEAAVEGEWGVPRRVAVAPAVRLDVGAVVTLHARGVPRLGGRLGFFEIGAGLHPITIVGHFTRSPAVAPPLPRLDDSLGVRTITMRVVDATVYTGRGVGGEGQPRVDCARVRQFARVVDVEERDPSPDLASLERRLREGGLDAFVVNVTGDSGIVARARKQYQFRHGRPLPLGEAAVVREFVAGVRAALQGVYDGRLPDA